ncbi:GNAT family N-acetyltransferase [Streptomyces sp. NPDC050504]|uniref:GNAT family N-acetyltransferase n=1 Tax=Streptomyces sp. NPDC050504 TaxID=3365618 RepID=UPI00378F39DD
MIVRPAVEADFPGFLALAAEVEHWFGAMVEEPGFHDAVRGSIRGSAALVAQEPGARPGAGLLGGLLFGADAGADAGGGDGGGEGEGAATYHLHWLVVAERARGTGAGRALVDDAVRRYVTGPAVVEVITFGADHPGAVTSGARVFYERLGFTPGEAAGPGPEGGSRQVYRRTVV